MDRGTSTNHAQSRSGRIGEAAAHLVGEARNSALAALACQRACLRWKPWNADWRTRATQPSLTACSATGVSGRHVIANVAMVSITAREKSSRLAQEVEKVVSPAWWSSRLARLENVSSEIARGMRGRSGPHAQPHAEAVLAQGTGMSQPLDTVENSAHLKIFPRSKHAGRQAAENRARMRRGQTGVIGALAQRLAAKAATVATTDTLQLRQIGVERRFSATQMSARSAQGCRHALWTKIACYLTGLSGQTALAAATALRRGQGE
mmetsp:Transcript_44956/g.103983  ORF Transcript_44956/g.103983 Transcript_44956/m.103983 type:complete len:264 (+) Transcript_44956:1632-2423(+)